MTHPLYPWNTAESNNDPKAWLEDAHGLDLNLAKFKILMLRITQLHGPSFVAKSVAIFNHIAAIPYSISYYSDRAEPQRIANLSSGDAYFKANLFVHLLRVLGVPARMRFLQLDGDRLFRGLSGIDLGVFVYPVVEVWLEENWWGTDAYILDIVLFMQSRRLLRKRGWKIGLGVHLNGFHQWNGLEHSFQRISLDDPFSHPIRDWGCFHSILDFLTNAPNEATVSWLAKTAYPIQAIYRNKIFHELREGKLKRRSVFTGELDTDILPILSVNAGDHSKKSA